MKLAALGDNLPAVGRRVDRSACCFSSGQTAAGTTEPPRPIADSDDQHDDQHDECNGV